MNNNEFIRGKRAEIDLISDGIYNCEELKELMKAFDTSELKLKNEVIPEEFYVSSTNDATYIIPINNDRYIKIGYEDYFKLQDNGDGTVIFSRPATKSEIQEILDCLKDSNRSK